MFCSPVSTSFYSIVIYSSFLCPSLYNLPISSFFLVFNLLQSFLPSFLIPCSLKLSTLLYPRFYSLLSSISILPLIINQFSFPFIRLYFFLFVFFPSISPFFLSIHSSSFPSSLSPFHHLFFSCFFFHFIFQFRFIVQYPIYLPLLLIPLYLLSIHSFSFFSSIYIHFHLFIPPYHLSIHSFLLSFPFTLFSF